MNREQFLIALISWNGVPYIWGGDSMLGIDCSGFVQVAMDMLGLDPKGDQSAEMLRQYYLSHGRPCARPYQLGDLLFYGREGVATHVGLCLGFNAFMEAAHGDHTIDTVAKALERGARVKVSACRDKDLLSAIRPNGLQWFPTEG